MTCFRRPRVERDPNPNISQEVQTVRSFIVAGVGLAAIIGVALFASVRQRQTPSQPPAGQAPAGQLPTGHYAFKGTVTSVNPAKHEVVIDAEAWGSGDKRAAAPGMEAMKMPYAIWDSAELTRIKPGQHITAEVSGGKYGDGRWELEKVVVLDIP